MYIAIENQVFYCYPDENGERKLFLTVHPDNGSDLSVEEQAMVLVVLLSPKVY